MQNMDSQVLPPLLNPRTTPRLAVENKYSVLDLPGNKFSGRAHDENK